MDRLASMTVFTRVVEVKSFTTAAKLLGISRAMASKHVQDLEHHLSIRLLNRTTRTLSLTDAGATFYDRCRQILELVQTAEEEAASQSLTATGKLRVAAPMSFGVGYVSPLVPSFLERHPDVRVDLVLNDRIVDLIDEGFDLAIRIGKLRDSSLIARKLCGTRLLVCAAPSYLARHGEPKRPEDLKTHRCLCYSLSSFGHEWQFRGNDGASVAVPIGEQIACNNGDALRLMAVQGAGLVQQPSFIVAEDIAAGRLMPVLGSYLGAEFGIHAVYPGSRNVVPKVRAFVDHMVSAFAPAPPWEMGKRPVPGGEGVDAEA